MISEDYIVEKLKAFVESDEGKKVIEKKYGIKNFKLGTNDIGVKKKELKNYGNKMKNILCAHMPQSNYNGFPIVDKSEIIIGSPIDGGSYYALYLSFKNGSLERDSLVPGEHLDNIVLLYTKGYEASRPAYGSWDVGNGEMVWVKEGVTSRAPNDFMKEAVQEFNQRYEKKGVMARLVGQYK